MPKWITCNWRSSVLMISCCCQRVGGKYMFSSNHGVCAEEGLNICKWELSGKKGGLRPSLPLTFSLFAFAYNMHGMFPRANPFDKLHLTHCIKSPKESILGQNFGLTITLCVFMTYARRPGHGNAGAPAIWKPCCNNTSNGEDTAVWKKHPQPETQSAKTVLLTQID